LEKFYNCFVAQNNIKNTGPRASIIHKRKFVLVSRRSTGPD